MPTPLWQPSSEEKGNTLLTHFSTKIQAQYDLPDSEYTTVHQWSIDYPELFWSPRITFAGLLDVPDKNGETKLE